MMEMYDEEWALKYEEYANASIAGRDGLFRLAAAALAHLPVNARILVVGCGTGSELLTLSSRNPGWFFEAIEPSEKMVDICRQRSMAAGFDDRVAFHCQSVAGLELEPCHAATAILVSQHLINDLDAEQFFLEIASNVIVGGPVFSADISLPVSDNDRRNLLHIWREQAVTSGLPEETPNELIDRLGKDVVARTPTQIEELLSHAGLENPQQVFQSTIYRAWVTKRASLSVV